MHFPVQTPVAIPYRAASHRSILGILHSGSAAVGFSSPPWLDPSPVGALCLDLLTSLHTPKVRWKWLCYCSAAAIAAAPTLLWNCICPLICWVAGVCLSGCLSLVLLHSFSTSHPLPRPRQRLRPRAPAHGACSCLSGYAPPCHFCNRSTAIRRRRLM
ncbi:hypothetical protein EDB80DRAFT_696500 [Ilyonectria destructans]|nr:hypothetical protein EDB80DRAFT_696500 [Ilyonectria destructans]